MEKELFVTKIHDVHIGEDYVEWVNILKGSYRKAQIKASVKVNSEKLLWNWQLGRDLVQRKAEERWGTGIVEQLSLDLQAEFPNEKGFSTSNIWYMKKWYLFYSENKNRSIFETLHQLGGELQLLINEQNIKLHQLGGEIVDECTEGLQFPALFAFIPWRHHVEIITKCETIEEAVFYIQKTISDGLSRSNLLHCIKADLFHKQGGAVSNFPEHLPAVQAELAQEITKENYDFNFISLPSRFSETQLEDALAHQLSRFLLELGSGFAFVGRQKEIVVAGKSRKIDLLFYHIHLKAYIVCELKVIAFQPEFLGKLNFYVNAVNNLFKAADDNPTIGLLICSDMDRTEVQWSFDGLTTPIGVATYSNVQIEDIKKQLPSIEELEQRIKLLEAELNKK
ncbi:MAG: PDDEXK nuclease domain-containing protein [Odoribacter sp.]|nr:PDDEXK nuclease domain-containing protein [Odoribacter sp.]